MAWKLIQATDEDNRVRWFSPFWLAVAIPNPANNRVRLWRVNGTGDVVIKATFAQFQNAVAGVWDYMLVTLESGLQVAVGKMWISEMDVVDGVTRLFDERIGWQNVQGTTAEIKLAFDTVV